MGKWVVCCAWPYVNAIPHLGTFIHLLSADVFYKYLKLKGEEAIFVSGSDEHGTPIEVEAIKAGVSPREITNKNHQAIIEFIEKYTIEFTNYTRTDSLTHIKVTQDIFKKIYNNGFIFSKEVELPYCTECKRFLPDRFIEGKCPYCSYEKARGDQCESCGKILDSLELINAKCVFCGSKPEKKISLHWFFDLPKFSESLKKYLRDNPRLPDNAKKFSLKWLEEGLKPRPITRDNKWGIPAPFPGAEEKTIYVWFEAVLGYISAVVEWSEKIGKPDLWKEFWFNKDSKNVHFIGKDNIPFHTIIFPALLLATKDPYNLPWQISSTEFILYESEKFSKSRKIGVWIDETLEIADSEYWRYVLIAMRPETKDANFTWEEFETHVNSELNDVLGNFINRTLTFIKKYFNGVVPSPSSYDSNDLEILKKIENISKEVEKLINEFKLRNALNSIIEFAREGNKYLSLKEPWLKIKVNKKEAETTLYLAVQMVHCLSILLAPFLPKTSEKILKQLGLNKTRLELKWDDASKLIIKPNHKIGEIQPLFHKISANEAKNKLEELRRRKNK
ncbi:MAG: methionine--tRNA ligase [Candidatus Bathyarchaeia archaeon]|nr:methionine--tRNA ligase [Candidatus Bathyarchaeota archaeon]